MTHDERLEVAGLAYLRAVALAREKSTPATWRRALTASRNLGTAIRDRDRALRGPATGVGAPPGRPPAGGS